VPPPVPGRPKVCGSTNFHSRSLNSWRRSMPLSYDHCPHSLVGRSRLDTFIKEYFTRHSFQAMDTESFVAYLRHELLDAEPGLEEKLNLQAWLNKPGIPAGAPPVHSTRFEAVEAARQAWLAGTPAADLSTAAWSSHEWVHFLQGLPALLSSVQLAELDAAFGFTHSGNNEILAAWFPHALAGNSPSVTEALEKFLTHVGRRKFLVPLYKALLAAPNGRHRAQAVYAQARPNYHSVARGTLDELVGPPR
ncbi:M1 family metallopeptidase, partial [Hymenobacter lutimineralis]